MIQKQKGKSINDHATNYEFSLVIYYIYDEVGCLGTAIVEYDFLSDLGGPTTP